MLSSLERVFRRKTSSLHYIPAIDGIRFLAIFLVFLYHAAQYFGKEWKGDKYVPVFWHTILENGHKGVPVFFMLSGFILSLPFAQQYVHNGRKVVIRDYYLRRLIRLEPPYFIAMTIFFCIAVSQSPEQWKHLLQSLLASYIYLHTILFRHFPYINGVAWTLEIEVQFYLIAPLLFLVFKLKKEVRRVLLLGSAIFFSLFPLINPLPFIALPDYFQYFLFGLLLTDYYICGIPAVFNHKIVWPLAILVLAYMIWLPLYHHRYTMPLFPLSIFLFLLMVMGNDGLRRLFSGKVITLIGGMCYSIYLIHGLLIIYIAKWVSQFTLGDSYMVNFALQAGIYACITLAVCAIFFILVEKPFMGIQFRKRTIHHLSGQA